MLCHKFTENLTSLELLSIIKEPSKGLILSRNTTGIF